MSQKLSKYCFFLTFFTFIFFECQCVFGRVTKIVSPSPCYSAVGIIVSILAVVYLHSHTQSYLHSHFTNSMSKVHVFPGKSQIGASLAEHVAKISEQAIKERGRVLVAISGGSLPKILASGLVQDDGSPTSIAQRIEWDKWHIFFADERVVPLDDKDSNFKACNEVMFSKVSSSETFLSQIHTIEMGTPTKVAAAYQIELQEALKSSENAFDLILLGMGPDGHTASLFPGHELLKESTLLVASIDNSPKLPPKRITLTYPVINGK